MLLRFIPKLHSVENICNFIEKSMIQNEITGEKQMVEKVINDLIKEKETALKSRQYFLQK